MIAITDDASRKIFYGLGGSFAKVWKDAQCPAGTKLARFKLIKTEMPDSKKIKTLLNFLKNVRWDGDEDELLKIALAAEESEKSSMFCY